MRQLPVLPPSAFSAADVAYLSERVLELVYTAWDLQPFAADLWAELDGPARARVQARWAAATQPDPNWPAWPDPQSGTGVTQNSELRTQNSVPPPFRWDDTRRAAIRAEIDARIARLYGLTRDELRYILDPADIYGPDFPGETFRVLKEREQRQYGEYRTRRLVLAAWDADPRPSPEFHHGDTETRRTVVEVDAVARRATATESPAHSAPPPPAAPPAPLVPVVAAAPPPPRSAPAPASGTLQPGDRVRHATLGEGTVREVTARDGEAVILVQFAAGPPRRFLAHTLARL